MAITEVTEAFAEVVENDPRIGAECIILASRLSGHIQRVERFEDGFGQFIVISEHRIIERFNSDEIEILSDGVPVLLAGDPREGLLIEKDGFSGVVRQVSIINSMEYIHWLRGDELQGAFGWEKFQVMEEVK